MRRILFTATVILIFVIALIGCKMGSTYEFTQMDYDAMKSYMSGKTSITVQEIMHAQNCDGIVRYAVSLDTAGRAYMVDVSYSVGGESASFSGVSSFSDDSVNLGWDFGSFDTPWDVWRSFYDMQKLVGKVGVPDENGVVRFDMGDGYCLSFAGCAGGGYAPYRIEYEDKSTVELVSVDASAIIVGE